jgi:hypothetical protein
MIGIGIVDALPRRGIGSKGTALMPSQVWEEPSREVADLPRNSPGYRADLNRRLGIAYVSGVEADAIAFLGRPLTAEEQEAAEESYPGDLPNLRDRQR